MAIPKGPDSYHTVTEKRAVNDTIEPAGMPKPTWKTKRLCSRAPPHGASWICSKGTGRCR